MPRRLRALGALDLKQAHICICKILLHFLEILIFLIRFEIRAARSATLSPRHCGGPEGGLAASVGMHGATYPSARTRKAMQPLCGIGNRAGTVTLPRPRCQAAGTGSLLLGLSEDNQEPDV
jgi:hypothetical protein